LAPKKYKVGAKSNNLFVGNDSLFSLRLVSVHCPARRAAPHTRPAAHPAVSAQVCRLE